MSGKSGGDDGGGDGGGCAHLGLSGNPLFLQPLFFRFPC